uniref:Putative secreted protein n=1 Tax=Anopheles darlingi TaxID=43151 RepID=A0A2M4DNL0_ANODA
MVRWLAVAVLPQLVVTGSAVTPKPTPSDDAGGDDGRDEVAVVAAAAAAVDYGDCGTDGADGAGGVGDGDDGAVYSHHPDHPQPGSGSRRPISWRSASACRRRPGRFPVSCARTNPGRARPPLDAPLLLLLLQGFPCVTTSRWIVY